MPCPISHDEGSQLTRQLKTRTFLSSNSVDAPTLILASVPLDHIISIPTDFYEPISVAAFTQGHTYPTKKSNHRPFQRCRESMYTPFTNGILSTLVSSECSHTAQLRVGVQVA